MLYPNFNDLIAYKDRKLGLRRISQRSVKSTAPGNYLSPFRGQGLEFDSVREYVPGDDIRRIDWRVTARTGSPHLKVFREDRERQITICIDMNSMMRFGTKKTFKSVLAAHVAALLGWEGIAHHDRVSACLFGDVLGGIQYFAPKRTKQSLCTLLKTLSEPPVEHHEISLQEALKQINQAAHPGSLIYIISDFMGIGKDLHNDACMSQLSKRCDVVCISVNDPADAVMYPMGLMGFHGSGRENVYLNTKNEAGREMYALQWKESRERLHEMGARFKVPVVELSTDSDELDVHKMISISATKAPKHEQVI